MAVFLSRRTAKLLSLPLLTASLFLAAPGANAATPVKVAAVSSMSEVMDRWTPYVKEAARRFNIAEDWIVAVMRMESGGRTDIAGQPITSKAGAMGVMQVMPATYKDMRAQYGLGSDPYDPHDNVLAGAAYLKWLHDKYGYPKMFAAYNAGPGTLEAHMAGKTKLPAETQAYVKGIARILGDKSPVGEKSPVMEASNEQLSRNMQPSRSEQRSRNTQLSRSEPPRDVQPSRISVTYLPAAPAESIATLTRPDGSSLTVDGTTVDSIRASLPDEYAPGVQTVIAMGNRLQGVREDPVTVSSLLKHPIANV